jgi:hypothetical protein
MGIDQFGPVIYAASRASNGMTRAWITTSSTHVEAMVNSLNAACEEGYVPDELHVLENPGVTEQVDRAIELASVIIDAYDGSDPAVNLTSLDSEVEFDRIQGHVKAAIERVHDDGGEVAVDITPGRKYMSAIAFAAGLRYGADHVYYFYLESSKYMGRLYPEMPRTATRLYDFTEEL